MIVSDMIPDETRPATPKFDFSAYPPDSLFHERRSGHDRRRPIAPEADAPTPDVEAETAAPSRVSRTRKDRRRRIDPTTFEKQYTDDELEFMNAVQQFKVQSGKPFPSHGDVLRVAASLGYRRVEWVDGAGDEDSSGESEPELAAIAPA
ncbi:hypothetical protein TA3x_001282 [Tundrisphaera sp. TA3]|uniref:hypothetical protein n=1 Tax=Tundrisphaera sp. TA3 TaxID=3435775 RepID=UPI003EBE9980